MENSKSLKQFIYKRFNIIKTVEEKEKENRVKDSIFGVLYVLLKEENHSQSHSSLTHFILYFLEFMEFMIFSFQPRMKPLWYHEEITNVVSRFFYIPNILFYVTDKSQYVYLTVFYSFIVLVTIVIANIFFVYYSFRRQYFTVTWPLYVLKSIARIICTVLFVPFLGKF